MGDSTTFFIVRGAYLPALITNAILVVALVVSVVWVVRLADHLRSAWWAGLLGAMSILGGWMLAIATTPDWAPLAIVAFVLLRKYGRFAFAVPANQRRS